MKKAAIFFAVVSAVLLLAIIYYQQNYKTIDEAIRDSNVPMDAIFHVTERKGHTLIFYGKDDVLSAGLIEKGLFGYRWSFGSGSEQFNESDQLLTRSFTNLSPRKAKDEGEELVSLTFGVIHDDSIEHVKIKYKDQQLADATIIVTNKGRIWYCFSETPVNYDPDVIRVLNDGTEAAGWY